MYMGRLLLSLLLSLYYFFLVTRHSLTPADGTLGSDILYPLNLIIHEAGHFIFTVPLAILNLNETRLGMLIGVFGGSFLQWFMPALFVGYFAIKRQPFATFVILFWLGNSLLASTPYIADAQTMSLPLLADGLIHDWNYLLTELNLLTATPRIARGVATLAILILTTSVGGSWYCSLKTPPLDETNYKNFLTKLSRERRRG